MKGIRIIEFSKKTLNHNYQVANLYMMSKLIDDLDSNSRTILSISNLKLWVHHNISFTRVIMGRPFLSAAMKEKKIRYSSLLERSKDYK